MEEEGGESAFSGCFSMDLKPPEKPSADACFDCNICLGFAVDPVITFCGHLYCWPCIYRWLNLDSGRTFTSDCPVCKSPFSESTLIPLYGRGFDVDSNRGDSGIPDRPTEHRKLVAASTDVAADRRHQQQQQIYPFYDDGRGGSIGIMHSTAGAVLSEIAFGMVPRASRNHRDFLASFYRSPEMAAGGRRGDRRRRLQELRVESLLHQLWCFLCCCALLCLLFF